jgi:hypothetical protein
MTIKQDMTSESRQLQYELQCQEALLVLMQKLKTNQRLLSQTNNIKQRTTTPPVNTTKQPPSVYQIYLKKITKILSFRIQSNHLIQINIPLIDQILIPDRNHQNSP